MTNMGSFDNANPPAETVHEPILVKMRSQSNWQILPQQIARGLRMIKAPEEAVKRLEPSVKVVMCLPDEKFGADKPSEGKDLARCPIYLRRQVDSYYYEDKPAGALLLGAEFRSVENGIFSRRDKIICALSSSEPKFAWVEPHYVMDDGMCYVQAGETDPRYLVALLNSSLMFFWFVHGAKKFRERSLELDERTLTEAPIVKNGALLGDLLVRLSNEASNLKKARRGYLDIWKNYSDYMKTGYIRLGELLAADAACTDADAGRGSGPALWGFTTAQGSAGRGRMFDYIAAKADPDNGLIRMSGIEGASAEGLMDMHFQRRELLLYVYCALNDPYSPKPSAISELLDVQIPVILPDHAKRTLEIEKAVMWDFRNYVSSEKLKPHDFRVLGGEALAVPKELFQIEVQLQRTLTSIDLVVFSIYGLSDEQAKRAMGALPQYLPHAEEVMGIISTGGLQAAVEAILQGSAVAKHEEAFCTNDQGSGHDNCQCGDRKS